MTAPSTPILRGSGGVVLRHEDDALTLRRGDEEVRIPLRAVERVSPGGRAVTVVVRVPEGAEPVVHVVQGVNDTPAYVFASTVGAALARLPEPEASFDGAALVTTRSLRPPRTPEGTVSAGVRARGVVWAVLGLGPGLGALITMSVLVVKHGEPGALILSLPLGFVAILLNVLSTAATEGNFRMWVLPRRGITVMAVRTSPYGKSGTYEYTDRNGVTHRYYRQAYASEVEISYLPDSPAMSVGVYPVFTRVVVALGALLLWAATIGLVVAMIYMGDAA
ncbi:hypothetical protein ACFYU9_08435 [Streptomyces sp. NPDC004327]|uniref:hypothetical protein n=1 Tax=unclassified Streptomyces TaxID=2593676 RepID=UPI0036ABE06A